SLATICVLSSAACTLGMTPAAAASTQSCASLVGTWGNRLGSTMTVQSVDPTTGAITGTYRSPSGTSGEQFPLVGWTNTAPAQSAQDNVTLVTFTVNWGIYGSITAWSGLCRTENQVPTIEALWHYAQSN
ncbi:avidin/streptavidin family protein, partial [Caballeronia sp. BR00000012568055]|uniref:avidin/streptavidin family protein n=1 Tax=Caballeronia sp. BR00000012568055 TaxID=2918761 RepID=UPI0023FA030E